MKRALKRCFALLLAVTTVLVGIPNIGQLTVYAKEIGAIVNKDETPVTPASDPNRYYELGKTTIRKVVNAVTELPQYGVSNFAELEQGTPERPFFILEIVPYEEFGEFGYQIGGCEPVNVDKMFGFTNTSATLMTINSFKTCNVKQITGDHAYFFPDEEQSKFQYYKTNETLVMNNLKVTDTTVSVDGYYEYVGSGGDFRITLETEGKQMTKVTAGTGEFVWHSINTFNSLHDVYAPYNDSLDRASLSVGDRIYTTRPVTDTDYCYDFRYYYYYYENKENFLTDTLLLTRQEAANYSVCIKTITPDELNLNPTWIDYADLIFISPGKHNEGIANLWKLQLMGSPVNRSGHTSTVSTYNANQFENNDLKASVALKIFDKATADENYAAVVIDNRTYDLSQTTFVNSKKDNVEIKVYNWNLEPTGEKYKVNKSSNNNVFKLTMMLVSMDSYIIKKLYLDPAHPYIKAEGNDLVDVLQTGDAKTYWSGYTLQAVDPDFAVYPNALYDYTESPYAWENFTVFANLGISSHKSFVCRHVYTYDGSQKMLDQFIDSAIDADDAMSNGSYIFGDFVEYMTDPEHISEFGIDVTLGADSSDALRYALGIRAKVKVYGKGKNLRILDLEPSVGLDNHSNPNYRISENYFKMLLPDFLGTVIVEHMTTAEFVGRTEDLNSIYDMIYLGLCYDAYHTKVASVTIGGKTVTAEITDFNDDNMDGKIYFHTGDKVYSSEYNQNGGIRDSRFVRDSSGNKVNTSILRYPGNDITKIKKDELISFINSGKPVVATVNLYNLESLLVDSNTHIYSLINTYKGAANKGIYSISETNALENKLRNSFQSVVFKSWPEIYNGTTSNSSSASIPNPNYVTAASASHEPMLKYTFEAPSDGYYYRLYVDQDRDGKFSSVEVVRSGSVSAGLNSVSYTLSASILGLVQWKLEVFKVSNYDVRNTITGCSAIARGEATPKEVIRVLQIMPKDCQNGDYTGWLNLQTNETYRKYYTNLADFDVQVTAITVDDYYQFFTGTGFAFDMSQPISETNPINLDKVYAKNSIEVNVLNANNKRTGAKTTLLPLNKYNMIIVGFGDAYGSVDIQNRNGAVEFLQYYTTMGKSILYTHDYTSIYNVQSDKFGYTSNAMMRDLMGMNRYKAVFTELANMSVAPRSRISELIAYQATRSYDYTTSGETQGLTSFAIKRFAWRGDSNENKNVTAGYKNPFKFIVYAADTYTSGMNPSMDDGSKNSLFVDPSNKITKSGFTNSNDVTRLARRLNEGQITQYPYLIGDELQIASTHAQWYELNMEDPEVTVWYTLADDTSTARRKSGDGCSVTYNSSPNDAANFYYIYSKGNIFYSGVGHSTAAGDAEAKLFVNTMIAAYRRGYDAPMAVVTKTEYSRTNTAGTSDAMLGKDVFKKDDQNYITDLPDDTEGTARYIRVYFYPKDMSLSNNLSYQIIASETGASYVVKEVYYAEQYIGDVTIAKDTVVAAVEDASHNWNFTGLKNNHLYYFYYPIANLQASDEAHLLDTVMFFGKNDRSEDVGETAFKMYLHELFQLD